MSNADRQVPSGKRMARIFVFCAGIALLAFALITVSLKMYLASPYPARQLSTLLSASLHQPVTVQAVHVSGLNLYLVGVSIADPPGFSGGTLLTAGSLAIKPHWGHLLRGRRSFRLIELDRLQIDLHKNREGIWNFSGLRQLFAKPAAGETLVRRLSLKNGSLLVNGQAVRGVSLDIRDLATKGSQDARVELTFRDDARNRYTLNGTVRGGSDPSFDLRLRAPALSLAGLSGLVKPEGTDHFRQARGDLRLAATLRKGRVLAHGEIGFRQIAAAPRIGPLSGRLLLDVSYQKESDQARLESLDLTVENLLQLRGTGKVSGLKSERAFELDLKAGDLELQQLQAFLPAEKRGEMTLSGRLAKASLQLAGSARQGITAIAGGADLRELSLTREGRLWISGLSGRVAVGKQAPGILVAGELSGRGSTKAALESIQAPFSLLLSPKLKPQKARFELLHARLLGCELAGRADYSLSASHPFSASLRGSIADLATVNPLLGALGLRVGAGKAAATLQAGGRDPRTFDAAFRLIFTELHGSRGQAALSLKQGIATARLARSRGQLTMAGDCVFTGVAAGGKSGQARLDYRLADNRLTLENGAIDWGGSTLRLARLAAAVPSAESRGGAVRYPLAIEISGAGLTHKAADARGISGRLDGYLVREGTDRWLEGSAHLAGGEIGWQGKPVAMPRGVVAFLRSGAKATISGAFLGGGLSAEAVFNPFAPAEGATFRLGLKGADLSIAAGFVPPRNGATVREGLLDGSVEGRYSGRDGISARVVAIGKDVTLVRSGKTLVSRAGISLAGDIAGQKITVGNARVIAGEGVSITADGTLENAFSDKRRGNFNLAVAQAPFNSFVDAFINGMPRVVQEATVAGSLSAHGTLELQGGRRLLQGALLLGKISLDSPGQAIDIREMDGIFPFSLDLSGGTAATVPKQLDFSRDNFQQLRQALSRLPESGQIVRIGRVALGKMEFGPVILHVKAANGLIEIVSVSSPLYEGTVLGTGWLLMKKGVNYRVDLLLGGMSLKELCSRFPAIKGYISGSVNGIVSLYGEGRGISGLYGFVDLWATEAGGEKMLVSRDFLQRLGGKKLSGIFFRKDIPYDRAEISALLEQGYLTFDTLDIVHTNIFGVRDLNVSIAPSQNRIALDYLIESIRQASVSGKGAGGQGKPSEEAVPAPEFKWEE